MIKKKILLPILYNKALVLGRVTPQKINGMITKYNTTNVANCKASITSQ